MTTKNSFYHILPILNAELKSFFVAFPTEPSWKAVISLSFFLCSYFLFHLLGTVRLTHSLHYYCMYICLVSPKTRTCVFFLKAIQPQLRAHNRYLIAYLGIDYLSKLQLKYGIHNNCLFILSHWCICSLLLGVGVSWICLEVLSNTFLLFIKNPQLTKPSLEFHTHHKCAGQRAPNK